MKGKSVAAIIMIVLIVILFVLAILEISNNKKTVKCKCKVYQSGVIIDEYTKKHTGYMKECVSYSAILSDVHYVCKELK